MSKLPPPKHSSARSTPTSTEASVVQGLFRDLQIDIQQVPIASLKPYGRKLKRHTKAHIAQLAQSIAAFGLVQPVLIDADGEIIAGHGVMEAARACGFDMIPVVRLDHLDEPQKRALRIALNRLAELSSWDEAVLAIEFKELLHFDATLDLSFDLAIAGFSHPEIDRLVTMGSSDSAGSDADDTIPEVGGPVVSRVGDLWMLGPHRLICGDATSPETYTALIGDEKATMAISDAPYNVKVNGHVSGTGRHAEFVMASGEMSTAEFSTFLGAFLAGASAVCRAGALQFVFMDWRHMGEVLAAANACQLELKNLCVWNKGSGGMGSFYRSQHELIFVLKQPGGPYTNNIQLGKFGRNRTNVWDHPGAQSLRKELALHATPKPVALIADAIRDGSNRGEIVLDAFSGSGTTIIAAAKTGRRGYAIELDPQFVDVAIKRWEAWSGKTAILSATGSNFTATALARYPALGCKETDIPLIAEPPPVRIRQRSRSL